jgi:hypothetical protein
MHIHVDMHIHIFICLEAPNGPTRGVRIKEIKDFVYKRMYTYTYMSKYTYACIYAYTYAYKYAYIYIP